MDRLPFIALAAALAAAPAAAAEQAARPARFQAALHAGYRDGGNLEDTATSDDRDLDAAGSLALALEMRYAPGDDRWFQLWYARQDTDVDDGDETHDVDVEYLHLGGTVPFGDFGRAQPYFAAGIGATRLSSPGADVDERHYFSGSLALGLDVPLATHASLRMEARGYVSAVDSDTALFCRSDGQGGLCRIRASGSTLVQLEALVGVAIRF